MGLLGKFLDRLCDERPDLAQQIIDREIGPLGQVFTEYRIRDIEFPNRTPFRVRVEHCGCIVGTVALAMGFIPKRDVDYNEAGVWAWDFVGEKLGWDPDFVDRVSLQVYDIASRLANGPRWRERIFGCYIPSATLHAEQLTVHLVRQRIALRLAMRSAVTP